MSPSPHRSRPVWSLALALLLPACAAEAPEYEQEVDGPEPVGEAVQAQTVAEAVANSCSTTSVKGLSVQIVDQANCIAPGAFVAIDVPGNLVLGSAVFPYLEAPAKDALAAALAAKSGTTMTVNSMLRTVAQQYLLYSWYLNGQCGIGLAAKPGGSNHETGLAMDINEYNTWKTTLESHGFAWFGNADAVHFDYVGAGAVSYKGTDVLAFQMLWNLNHPDDLIDEDGAYGPQTESRLVQSPADGFPIPPACDPDPTVVIDPDYSFPQGEGAGGGGGTGGEGAGGDVGGAGGEGGGENINPWFHAQDAGTESGCSVAAPTQGKGLWLTAMLTAMLWAARRRGRGLVAPGGSSDRHP